VDGPVIIPGTCLSASADFTEFPNLEDSYNDPIAGHCGTYRFQVQIALRIVLVTVPSVGRSCEHFPDGFDLHLLHRRALRHLPLPGKPLKPFELFPLSSEAAPAPKR